MIVGLAGAIIIGLAGAQEGSNPPGDQLVYSPDLQMEVPQAKLAAIKASESAGIPVPPETPSDTQYTTSPEQIVPGIHSAAGWQVPFGMNPTNLWLTQDRRRLEVVYAGAEGTDAQTGLLIAVKVFYDSGGGETKFRLAPHGTGALTITAVNGKVLSFTTQNGRTGTFSLTTEQLNMTS